MGTYTNRMNKTNDKCMICGREFGGAMQQHHLRPKTFKNRDRTVLCSDNLVNIHKICHSAIHALFTEKELFDTFHAEDSLRSHPDMVKFIKWVSTKSVDFYVSMKRSNRRK